MTQLGERMSTITQEFIASFDLLPTATRFEVAFEILRRTKDFDFAPLTNEDLVLNAEILFLELDQQEMNHERSDSW